jgi:hypothetical protein
MIETALALFLDAGLAGAATIILAISLGYVYRTKDSQLEKARATHLEDMRQMSTVTDAIRLQVQALENTARTLIDHLRVKGG